MRRLLPRRGRLRFDRNELSGAFGDIGTDFPLIAGMILAARLDPASVLVAFGAMQVLTGLLYGLPMPAQPLKAMAVLVIAGRADAETLRGGGLAIGAIMLALAASGLLEALARFVPRSVVRGIQLGLGLQLASLALGQYVSSAGARGYALAAAAFALALALAGNRRFPPALPVIGLGLVFAFAFETDLARLGAGLGFAVPALRAPSLESIAAGLVALAIPQLPLSLANSVLATRQVVEDLFPEHRVTVRKIGLTYALMNLVCPLFGGVPACHGAGGLAGHHAFGARTGGSVVLYGGLYLFLGLFLSEGFREAIELFPKPILGVVLLFEALALARLVGDLGEGRDLALALLVGLVCLGLPYGYAVGLVLGILLARFWKRPLA